MDTYNILPVNKPVNFKHTLDHLAREWYDSLTFPIAWNDLQQCNQHDLNTVITMVKDIYAKKPEVANPPAATGGATAPFTLIKAPNGANRRVHFQGDEIE